jgi:FkbM family methyltransferase
MPRASNTPKDPGLIYDVGLHHGQDTDYYLKKGYRVVAFEADSANAAFCQMRFEDEIAAGRLTIVEGAITDNRSSNGNGNNGNGNGNGKVKFYRNADHSLWGSTSEDWAIRNTVMGTTNELISVAAVDFGECLEKYGVPHYLKADIVGSETVCLNALLDFEEKPDYISIRSEKVVFRRLEREFDLLEELGYDRFKVIKQEFEGVQPELPSSNGRRVHTFEEGASGPFGEDTAGKWAGREAAIADYRRIFVKYWLFGDYSYLIQTQRGRQLIASMERVVGRSIPGWYDTHAAHNSVKK